MLSLYFKPFFTMFGFAFLGWTIMLPKSFAFDHGGGSAKRIECIEKILSVIPEEQRNQPLQSEFLSLEELRTLSQKPQFTIKNMNNEQNVAILANFPERNSFDNGRGGGMLAVGGDQGLTLAVGKESSHLWVYDYDPKTSVFWRILLEGLKQNPTPADFLAFMERFEKDHLNEAEQSKLSHLLSPEGLKIHQLFSNNANLSEHFQFLRDLKTSSGDPGSFLATEKDYSYARKLAIEDHITFVRGNHLDKELFAKIGHDADLRNTRFHNIYLSNTIEQRYLMDPNHELAKFVTLAGDRVDASSVLSRLEDEVSGIENAAREGKLDIVNHYLADLKEDNGQIIYPKNFESTQEFLELQDLFLEAASNGWNQFFKNLGTLPFSIHADILSSLATPFRLADIDPSFYTIVGKESRIEKNGMGLEWEYTMGNLTRFLNSEGAIDRHRKLLTTRMNTLKDRLLRLKAGNSNSISPENRSEIETLLTKWDATTHNPLRGGSINGAEARAMDLDGMNLPIHAQVSQNRIRSLTERPILDAHEIRARQDAIHEILLENDGNLLKKMKDIYGNEESQKWRRTYYNSNDISVNLSKSPDVFTLNSMEQSAADGRLSTVGYINPEKVSEFEREETERKEGRIAFLKEVQTLSQALKGTHSPRLDQLRWILQACSDSSHPYFVEPYFRDLLDNPKNLRFDQLKKISAMPLTVRSRLKTVEQAYGELAMYYDLAKNANQRGWTHFARILDPEEFRPTIIFKDAHNPRVLEKSKVDLSKPSIPNDFDASPKNGTSLVISGPNGQGKTTLGRTVVQSLLFSQLGSPGPFEEAALTPLLPTMFIRPPDDPTQELSSFMAVGGALSKFAAAMKANPYRLLFLDEPSTGSIPEINADLEVIALNDIGKTGAIVVATSHQKETLDLAIKNPGVFRNMHFENFRFLPGPLQDLGPMYEGAATALEKANVKPEWIEALRARAQERLQKKTDLK
jgi:hypothetical protein